MKLAMAWYSLANQIVKSNPLLLHLSSTFAITVWTKLNRLTPFVLWTLNLCLATQNTHGIYKRPGACKIQTDPLHLSVSSISYQLFIKVGSLPLLKRNKICKFLIDKVNRCLARYSPRPTTTNWPTNRAPNMPAWPGPNWPKMPFSGQIWSFLGKKSFFLLEKS